METDRKQQLNEAKQRKKSFLKAMPDDQRRLLLMHQRTLRHAKMLVYLIPVVIVLLLVLYFVAGFRFEYENKWLINGIALGALAVIITTVLLILRASSLKRVKALSSPISDFITEYGKINERIRDLKKPDPAKKQ